MPDKRLEFWFEYGSTYTYLTVARLASVADGRKIMIDWRPFLLMPILIEQGLEKGPFLPYPNKLRYMWRDLERRARRHSIPYQKPSLYPPNTLLTARIGYLAQSQHWCADFTREVFRLHWTEGVIIGTDENIRRGLSFAGQDLDRIVATAQSDENKTGLRRQTERAKRWEFLVRRRLWWETNCSGEMIALKTPWILLLASPKCESWDSHPTQGARAATDPRDSVPR